MVRESVRSKDSKPKSVWYLDGTANVINEKQVETQVAQRL